MIFLMPSTTASAFFLGDRSLLTVVFEFFLELADIFSETWLRIAGHGLTESQEAGVHAVAGLTDLLAFEHVHAALSIA